MRSGRVRGRVGGDAYLLEQVHERLDFPATLAAVRNMRCRWPGAEAKLIEDKANGSGWRQRLRREKILPRYTCTVHCLLVPTQTLKEITWPSKLHCTSSSTSPHL
jgi:phage terminase large subunit-like protein